MSMREDDRPEVSLRPAGGADARWAAELWAESFPGEPRPEVRLQAILEGTGPLGGLETCWVAEMDGRLVGAFRIYPLRMHLWGRVFRVQGVASVAVAPSARRAGLGRRICEKILGLGIEEELALSALYPFRAGFYARLGYVLVGELHRYRVRAEDLPDTAGSYEVNRVGGKDARRALPPIYEAVLGRSNGLIERTQEMWSALLDGVGRAYVATDRRGVAHGYVLTEGRRRRSPDRHTLSVKELVALDDEAYSTLLGWLSRQKDQWRLVEYDALPGERFHHLLRHPAQRGKPPARGLWFPSATLLRGPMLRILDLRRTLETLGLGSEAEMDVQDDQISANTGRWRVGFDVERVGTAEHPLSIGRVPELFVAGRLPGQEERAHDWRPAMDLRDFRLLDVF